MQPMEGAWLPRGGGSCRRRPVGTAGTGEREGTGRREGNAHPETAGPPPWRAAWHRAAWVGAAWDGRGSVCTGGRPEADKCNTANAFLGHHRAPRIQELPDSVPGQESRLVPRSVPHRGQCVEASARQGCWVGPDRPGLATCLPQGSVLCLQCVKYFQLNGVVGARVGVPSTPSGWGRPFVLIWWAVTWVRTGNNSLGTTHKIVAPREQIRDRVDIRGRGHLRGGRV